MCGRCSTETSNAPVPGCCGSQCAREEGEGGRNREASERWSGERVPDRAHAGGGGVTAHRVVMGLHGRRVRRDGRGGDESGAADPKAAERGACRDGLDDSSDGGGCRVGDGRDGRAGDETVLIQPTIADSDSKVAGTLNPFLPPYRVKLLVRHRADCNLHCFQDYVEYLTWVNAWPWGIKQELLLDPDIYAHSDLFTRQLRQWREHMDMYCGLSRQRRLDS